MADDIHTTIEGYVQERYRDAGKISGPARKHRPTKPCQQEGCNGWAWAQGYCDPHYQKRKREGLLTSKRIVGDPVARFHSSYQVNPVTGCWEWTGWIHPKGYGILPMGGKAKKIRAHRFSWELRYGAIPEGLFPCHTCDNRRCVNFAHLFLGDEGVNARDCVTKGRHNSQTGTNGPKISDEMAMNIRVMYARGLPAGYSTKANPLSTKHLASIYGVSMETISGIVKGKSHLAV